MKKTNKLVFRKETLSREQTKRILGGFAVAEQLSEGGCGCSRKNHCNGDCADGCEPGGK